MKFKWEWERLKYKFVKVLLSIRYYIIRILVGKMPVIANCKVYDDIVEYNIGKTRSYRSCMFYNNHIVEFRTVAMKYAKEEMGLRTKSIKRSKNGAMALDLSKGEGLC